MDNFANGSDWLRSFSGCFSCVCYYYGWGYCAIPFGAIHYLRLRGSMLLLFLLSGCGLCSCGSCGCLCGCRFCSGLCGLCSDTSQCTGYSVIYQTGCLLITHSIIVHPHTDTDPHRHYNGHNKDPHLGLRLHLHLSFHSPPYHTSSQIARKTKRLSPVCRRKPF